MSTLTKPPELRIGPLVADLPIVLAPMAGYTDLPCRLLARQQGAGLVYTEMCSVDGLARNQGGSRHILTTDPAERPVVAHLYGQEPEMFAKAAMYVERLGRFAAIDINAGCPVPKVLRRGAGAGLIKTPARLYAIVRAVKQAVRMPVTVKTRIGSAPGQTPIDELALGLEAAGADALALHARYASHGHRGPADWDVIARIKARLRIPVIGNGGLLTAAQAVDTLRRSGVDAVMIGRAAMGNPWIFAEARALLRGGTWTPPSLEERRAAIVTHLHGLVALTRLELPWRRRQIDPEVVGARHFRPHLLRYVHGLPGALELRRGLEAIRSPADVIAAADRVLAEASAARAMGEPALKAARWHTGKKGTESGH